MQQEEKEEGKNIDKESGEETPDALDSMDNEEQKSNVNTQNRGSNLSGNKHRNT